MTGAWSLPQPRIQATKIPPAISSQQALVIVVGKNVLGHKFTHAILKQWFPERHLKFQNLGRPNLMIPFWNWTGLQNASTKSQRMCAWIATYRPKAVHQVKCCCTLAGLSTECLRRRAPWSSKLVGLIAPHLDFVIQCTGTATTDIKNGNSLWSFTLLLSRLDLHIWKQPSSKSTKVSWISLVSILVLCCVLSRWPFYPSNSIW